MRTKKSLNLVWLLKKINKTNIHRVLSDATIIYITTYTKNKYWYVSVSNYGDWYDSITPLVSKEFYIDDNGYVKKVDKESSQKDISDALDLVFNTLFEECSFEDSWPIGLNYEAI